VQLAIVCRLGESGVLRDQLAQEGPCAADVVMAGFVSERPDLARFYNTCEAFGFPSLLSKGLPVLEQ